MSLVTYTPRDHLGFLNLVEHPFGHYSATSFFWIVCLSLMAQYPSLDRVTVWKPPFKRRWSCTKVSKVGVLEIETDPETGSKGVWSPCSEFVLLPWVIVRSYSTNVLLPTSSLIWKSTSGAKASQLTEINRSYFPLLQRPRLNKIMLLNKPLGQHQGCSCSQNILLILQGTY